MCFLRWQSCVLFLAGTEGLVELQTAADLVCQGHNMIERLVRAAPGVCWVYSPADLIPNCTECLMQATN